MHNPIDFRGRPPQPNLVHSSGVGAHSREIPAAWLKEMLETRQKHMANWRTVKAARFNAAKRLERKQRVSTFALAVAGVVGFIVPVFTLTFDQSLSKHVKSIVEFSSYVIGTMSLTIGLVEQAKDYPTQAKRFDKCGRAVNSTLRKLRNNPHADLSFISELTREYETAINECEINHDTNDERIALLDHHLRDIKHKLKDDSLPEQRRKNLARDLRWTRAELWSARGLEAVSIYLIYAFVWFAPVAIALIVWHYVPAPQ